MPFAAAAEPSAFPLVGRIQSPAANVAPRGRAASPDACLARDGAGRDLDLSQTRPRLGHTLAVMDRNGIFFRLSIAWLVFLTIAIFYVVAR
jgi:hypothetical protein